MAVWLNKERNKGKHNYAKFAYLAGDNYFALGLPCSSISNGFRCTSWAIRSALRVAEVGIQARTDACIGRHDSGSPGSFPTVNGLFFVDGDVDRCSFLQDDTEGGTRGKLYTAIDGTTVYFALVVDETVNDNVCLEKDLDPSYAETSSWGNTGGGHTCAALIGSDHAKFGVERAGDGNNDFNWQQDLVYADGPEGTTTGVNEWFFDHRGIDGNAQLQDSTRP